jgi:capsular polysaccharide transport system permease protein
VARGAAAPPVPELPKLGPIALARARADAEAAAAFAARAAPAADIAPPAYPSAGAARMRRRHVGLILAFLVMVVAPLSATGWYLWRVALPQYDSRLGFSVQKEDVSSALQILGGLTELTGSSTNDTDILFKYIQSRELVRVIHDRLDLVAIYTRPDDPVFSLGPEPTLEELEAHWDRKVDVFYDTSSSLIEVRALAFTPEDAHAIATAISDESTAMLNRLSAIARQDATRYASEELEVAKTRLREARQALTAFRIRSQIVDPAADVQGRMGLLNNLLAQQAAALIDLDILASNTGSTDPRFVQAQKRVEVIEARIRAERARFGENPEEEDARYADLVAEFEALSVDLEFAQQAYVSALASYDSAVAEAARQSRYLATYLPPTMAERSIYPQRALIFGLAAGLLVSIWMITTIVFYSLRDRR